MITVLTGDNSFELNQALELLAQGYAGEISRADGSNLTLDGLFDLVSSLSLFSEKRMVIIRDLSSNKPVWMALGENLDRVSDDIDLVLVEPGLDKRTATYKKLQKVADIKVYAAWGDRDGMKAEAWVSQQAKTLGVTIDKKCVQLLVYRVGLNQWQLYHALEKLAVLDHVDEAVISEIIETQASENVFNLLDAALNANASRVHAMIAALQLSQDPYMTFGLLSGQVFQLAALSVADEPANSVASAIGAHPYALSKLAPQVKKLGKNKVKSIVSIFADTDMAMKSTGADPWLLIEDALIMTSLS